MQQRKRASVEGMSERFRFGWSKREATEESYPRPSSLECVMRLARGEVPPPSGEYRECWLFDAETVTMNRTAHPFGNCRRITDEDRECGIDFDPTCHVIARTSLFFHDGERIIVPPVVGGA